MATLLCIVTLYPSIATNKWMPTRISSSLGDNLWYHLHKKVRLAKASDNFDEIGKKLERNKLLKLIQEVRKTDKTENNVRFCIKSLNKESSKQDGKHSEFYENILRSNTNFSQTLLWHKGNFAQIIIWGQYYHNTKNRKEWKENADKTIHQYPSWT